MTKYKILRGNTPKFQSFVVETAYLMKLKGAVLNKSKNWSYIYWQKRNIGTKAYLTTYQGGGHPLLEENTKY